MEKDQVCQHIAREGLIAIIRADSPGHILDIISALLKGGIRIVEITMTTPGALNSIGEIYHNFGDKILLGLGTVLDVDTALDAIDRGISFIVTPTYIDQVVKVGRENSILVIPGCYSPTEMFMAWRSGSNLLKLFPASIAGPKMLKAILAPLPDLKIIPTGGVNMTNIKEFFESGAIAVGVGGDLVKRALLQKPDFDALSKTAREYVEEVNTARASIS